MSEKKQTRLAQFISLGVGIISILVSMVLANGEIKSAYEWFNSFMGLVLGVLAGIFVLGAFSKKASKYGAYAGFIVSAILVIYLKYTGSWISSWAYSLISIVVTFVVGSIVSMFAKNKEDLNIEATIFANKKHR